MMTRIVTSSLFVALALAAAPALAQDKPAQAPPKLPTPAPEMKNLAVFDGNWTCEGTMPPSPMGPGGKMTSTVSARQDLGGFWRTGTVKGTMEIGRAHV